MATGKKDISKEELEEIEEQAYQKFLDYLIVDDPIIIAKTRGRDRAWEEHKAIKHNIQKMQEKEEA